MPTNTLYSVFFHLWFLILCFVGHAQITIQDNLTPTQLVQEYFAGPGLSISNISFQGNLLQIGAFKNGTSSIQIDSGLVISTNQTKALNPSYNGTLQNAFSIQQDLDLKNIANSVPAMIGQNFTVTSVNDVAAIEFDFIPSSDSVFFNFVFGTDEYMEWVNTPFNDVFAFLISGPGITGSYSSPSGFSGELKILVPFQIQAIIYLLRLVR